MTPPNEPKKVRHFVPPDMQMSEFTFRAVLLGLVMTVVLGAANAYLGLKAGMTIAATYPAAVIGMAVLRLMKGSILEENIARTVGSIGESVAAGEIHKAGQIGSRAAALLFKAMGFGAAIYFVGSLKLFSISRDFTLHIGEIGRAHV